MLYGKRIDACLSLKNKAKQIRCSAWFGPNVGASPTFASEPLVKKGVDTKRQLVRLRIEDKMVDGKLVDGYMFQCEVPGDKEKGAKGIAKKRVVTFAVTGARASGYLEAIQRPLLLPDGTKLPGYEKDSRGVEHPMGAEYSWCGFHRPEGRKQSLFCWVTSILCDVRLVEDESEPEDEPEDAGFETAA